MKPGISRKFILIILTVFSSCILLMSLSFGVLLRSNLRVIKGTLMNISGKSLLDKTAVTREYFSTQGIPNLKAFSRAARKYVSGKQEILQMVIFSKTPDENYFRVEDTIKNSDAFTAGPEKKSAVKEEGPANYIKQGLLDNVIDPEIHLSGNIPWQAAYFPVRAGKKLYVAGLFVSALSIHTALKEYSAELNRLKIFIIAATVILVSVAAVAGYLFLNNFALLIKSLSSSINRAARGELDVNLNPETDEELSELALSFNSLMGEIKELKEKEKIIQEMETRDISGDIFKVGVTFMKEGRIDEAVGLFTSLIMVNPDGFGSYFNLGVAYAKRKDYTMAERMLGRALELNPEHELTRQYIAKVENLRIKYGHDSPEPVAENRPLS